MGAIKDVLFANDQAPDGTLAFRVLDRETGKTAIVCPACMDDPAFFSWFDVGESGPEPMSQSDLQDYAEAAHDVPRSTVSCACCVAEIPGRPRSA